jgi:glycosyltransferase involved in cell wall biosynthesis
MIQWISHPSRVVLAAKLLNLAVKLQPLKSSSVDGLVQDIKARPATLRHFYQRYDAMITPTRFLQSAYRSNNFTGLMKNMWFGVDIDRRAKPVRDANHVLQIGFIGQLAAHKGTDLLVDAFATLPKGSALLSIYGPKDQSPPFTELLLEKSQGLDVRLMGVFPPAQMAEVLADIDVLVIPSRWYENSPLVLLNALASHTPVVVSDVPGLTEFVEPGVNGFAFRRGDWKALAAVLRGFVDGSVDAAQMGRNTHFERTTRTMAEEVASVYREVVASRASTPAEMPNRHAAVSGAIVG